MKRALLLGPLLIAGCTSQLPGEPVATYRVVMSLVENTCGAQAIISTDGKEYSVELRQDGVKGYWRRAGRPAVQGTLDADYNFTFTSSGVVASEQDAGVDGCQLVQDEVLSGSLRADAGGDGGAAGGDAGAAAAGAAAAGAAATRDAGTEALGSLIGEDTLRITSLAGTDCSRALAAGGGPFEALPCTVRYKLTGVRRDPF